MLGFKWFLLCPIALTACGGEPSEPPADASASDVRVEVAVDAPSDVAVDTQAPEAGSDVAPNDVSRDAVTPDVGSDASPDATTLDAMVDATASDATVDATAPDVTVDATAPDVGVDVASDTASDAATDAPAPFDPSADFMALTEGVRTINLGPSLASALVVHGPTAFSVVYDRNHATLIAAGRAGAGYVMEFGHEGLLYAPTNTTDDRGALTLNAVRWMTRGRPAPVVGIEGTQTELRTFLMSRGFTVRSATVSDLSAVQVFITGASNVRTEADIGRLQTWVREGGGLMMGGHAWYWGYSNENAAVNFPGNMVLGALGITISSENDPENNVAIAVRAPTDLDHAERALERVRQHSAGTSLLTLADQVIASNVVRRGVRVMDIASSYMTRVRAIRRLLPDVIPSMAAPVRPATQPLPALTVTIDTRLASGLPPAEITAHPASADFPGSAAGVPVTVTRAINATYAGRTDRLGGNADRPVWRSTGLYAAPGARVTVTIPSTAAGLGLTALIGSWTDDNFSTDAWSRMPVITRSFPLTSAVTETASAFGGLVYVRVPRGVSLGTISVTIAGAIPAPRYVHGVTTLDAWRTTERALPGLYAELETDKLVLTVPASLVRALNDPSALMAWWDRVMDADSDLAANDRVRARAERIVFDRQIVAGYMHAGYPIMAFTPQASEAINLTALSTTGNWGFFHELGHNHQFADWSWTGTGENTVNLWSVYVMEHVVGLAPRSGHSAITPAARATRVTDYITGGRNFARDWSVWLGLETFLQLQEGFGWSFFTAMNTEYMALSDALRPRTEADRINGWVSRSCRIANRNLAPFYTQWAFPLTDAARTACGAYPAWAENPMR